MQHVRGVNGPILGHYRISYNSGLTTGLAAGASLFEARWATSAFIRAAILRFRVAASLITPFTAAQEVLIDTYLASAFTASASGGSNVVPAAGMNSLAQVSESAQASQFTSIQVCSAAALTAGTRTLDSQPFLIGTAAQALAAASAAMTPLLCEFNCDSDQKMPLHLQGATPAPSSGQQVIPGVQPPATPAAQPNNAQGIVVLNSIAQGAAGVIRFTFDMEWVEYATNAAETLG